MRSRSAAVTREAVTVVLVVIALLIVLIEQIVSLIPVSGRVGAADAGVLVMPARGWLLSRRPTDAELRAP